MSNHSAYRTFVDRLSKTKDSVREKSTKKRKNLGLRTARENLDDLVDPGSFLEFGAFAVAAQRNRRDYEELQLETSADGILTGFCNINEDEVGEDNSHAAAIIYDYSVLAGSQGFFHHQKL